MEILDPNHQLNLKADEIQQLWEKMTKLHLLASTSHDLGIELVERIKVHGNQSLGLGRGASGPPHLPMDSPIIMLGISMDTLQVVRFTDNIQTIRMGKLSDKPEIHYVLFIREVAKPLIPSLFGILRDLEKSSNGTKIFHTNHQTLHELGIPYKQELPTTRSSKRSKKRSQWLLPEN